MAFMSLDEVWKATMILILPVYLTTLCGDDDTVVLLVILSVGLKPVRLQCIRLESTANEDVLTPSEKKIFLTW